VGGRQKAVDHKWSLESVQVAAAAARAVAIRYRCDYMALKALLRMGRLITTIG